MKTRAAWMVAVLAGATGAYGAGYVGFTQPGSGEGNGNGGGSNWVATNTSYTMSGWMYAHDKAYGTVTNVSILRNGLKLGDATLVNPANYGSWSYSWSPVIYGSNTLQAIAHSAMGNGTATVSGVFVATNAAPTAFDVTNSVVEGGTAYVYPSYQDPDAGQTLAAISVSSPAHGTVIDYGRYFHYTSTPGFAGTDSFTYKVSDGFDDSNIATVTLNIQGNTPPIAFNIRAEITVNTNRQSIAASFTDPDSAQTKVARVVSPPAHGTATNTGATLYYTPAPDYAGPDAFTYKVNDSAADSNVARCQLLVRPANNPCGALVAIVVNSNLFVSAISNEVTRLKTDLQNEGYTATIKLWNLAGSGRNQYSSNLWAYLRSEYDNTNQFLEGAILIGDVPKAQTYAYHPYYGAHNWYYTDLIYWNMTQYQTNDEVTACNIWASRINADDTAWGAQDVLIRRALDANHNYRTGASRLPFTAYVFDVFTTNPVSATLRDVWPTVRAGGGGDHNAQFKFLPARTDLPYAACDSFAAGGEVFNQTSHGDAGGYMEGSWFDENALYRTIAQTRVALIGSCTSGAFGGIANNHLFTRGGGCVIAVGGTDINYAGDFQINESYGNEVPFRRRLAAGDSWGGACLYSYPFAGSSTGNRIVFYGDFSLKAMASVQSNAMPQIASFGIVTNSWNSYTFTVNASDPDGTITNVEWFCTGYDSGRSAPSYSTNSGTVTHTYAAGGTYTIRVEVIDNYQARDWREITLTVTPSAATTYASWKQSRFTPTQLADPHTSGDLASPAGDGCVNLLKYAFGFEPFVTHTGAVLRMSATNGYLTLVFPRSKSATDVQVVVEGADALADGAWSTNGIVELYRLDNGSNWSVAVRDGVPMGQATNRFLWLYIAR